MLSYRHGFHAGNFADVFKHILLIYLIKNLKLIGNLTFIDGFAGGGKYFTENEFMKKKEYKTGILKLLNSKFDDIFIETYLDIVRKYNQANVFKVYPGSGLIASEIMDKKFNFLTSIKIILENNILRMQGTGFLILNYKKEISSSLNQTLNLVINFLKEKNKKNFLSINNYNI